MSENYPYYYRTWFVVFMLVLFFPIGCILMWKGNKFKRVSRIIVTIIGLLPLIPSAQRVKKQIS